MESVREFQTVGKASLPQMDGGYAGSKGYDPIHELMRAIILRAIEDYKSGGELREEALSYMYDDGDDEDSNPEDYVFSFKFICQYLGFDPEKTRHSIVNAKHRISTRRRAA